MRSPPGDLSQKVTFLPFHPPQKVSPVEVNPFTTLRHLHIHCVAAFLKSQMQKALPRGRALQVLCKSKDLLRATFSLQS